MFSFFQKAGLAVIAGEIFTELALSVSTFDIAPNAKLVSVILASVVSIYSAYFKGEAIKKHFFHTVSNNDDDKATQLQPLIRDRQQNYGTNSPSPQAYDCHYCLKKLKEFCQFSPVLLFSLSGAAGQSVRAFFQANEMLNSLPTAKNYLSYEAGQSIVITSAGIAGIYSLFTEGVTPIKYFTKRNQLQRQARNELSEQNFNCKDNFIITQTSKCFAFLGSLNHASLEGGSIYFLLSEAILQHSKLDSSLRELIAIGAALGIGVSLWYQNYFFQGKQVTENCQLSSEDEMRRFQTKEADNSSITFKKFFLGATSLVAHFSLSFFTVDRGLKNLPKSGLPLLSEVGIKTISASAATIAAGTEFFSETIETFHEIDEQRENLLRPV
jgi:hypothetical protein